MSRRRKPKDYWTATDINLINLCPRKYFYRVVMGIKTPMSGDMARGVFMHRRIEKFFKEDGTPKNKSAEAWANTCANIWNRFVISTGKMRGSLIEWRDEKEPWILKDSIHKTCLASYNFLAEQGKPLLTEYPFYFSINRLKFKGVIDEVREGMFIRDYKTGYARIGEMDRLHGYQLTLYALAFCALCHSDEKFRRTVGVSDEEAATWGGNSVLISDKIQVELNQLLNWDSDKRIMPREVHSSLEKLISRYEDSLPQEVKSELNRLSDEHRRHILPPRPYASNRTDIHAKELLDLVEWFEAIKSSGEYWPIRGNHCNQCEYRGRCDTDTLKSKITCTDVQLSLLDSPRTKKHKDKRIHRQLELEFEFLESKSV